jgi:hypothetical protein
MRRGKAKFQVELRSSELGGAKFQTELGSGESQVLDRTRNDSSFNDPSISSPVQTSGSPSLLHTGMNFDSRAYARREEKEYQVSDFDDKVVEPLKALELYILQETHQKSIADSYREQLDTQIRWVDPLNGKEAISPSPIELYKKDPRYRQFVQTQITIRLKNQAKRFNTKGYTQTLCSPGTYKWFFVDYAPNVTLVTGGKREYTEEEIIRLQNEAPALPE